MYEIGLEGLQQLYREGRRAAKYAREHYDLLASREIAYTLYGPDAYDIGVHVPSKIVPTRARKLLTKTRRKDYMIYQLDNKHRPLRTVHMLDYTKIDCTYHHFEMNGSFYAYPFREDTNKIYNDEISILKYSGNTPVCYAIVSRNLLFVQFYEYPDPDKMIVSTYRYWPSGKTNMYGCPVDFSAPIGAPNSPVQRHCTEEVPAYIHFSQWIK